MSVYVQRLVSEPNMTTVQYRVKKVVTDSPGRHWGPSCRTTRRSYQTYDGGRGLNGGSLRTRLSIGVSLIRWSIFVLHVTDVEYATFLLVLFITDLFHEFLSECFIHE